MGARNFRKIDPEKLKAYVEEHPDAYQSEMAEVFGCSESGIRDALRRYKITRKKDNTLPGAGQGKSSGLFLLLKTLAAGFSFYLHILQSSTPLKNSGLG